MDSDEIVVMRAIVDGYVQGVFFRATTRDHAKVFGIEGTVRNVPDGTVEIYARGTKKQLEQFISHLKEKPGMGRVSSVDIEYLNGDYSFTGFKIVY